MENDAVAICLLLESLRVIDESYSVWAGKRYSDEHILDLGGLPVRIYKYLKSLGITVDRDLKPIRP
jgi:hypothetical protein